MPRLHQPDGFEETSCRNLKNIRSLGKSFENSILMLKHTFWTEFAHYGPVFSDPIGIYWSHVCSVFITWIEKTAVSLTLQRSEQLSLNISFVCVAQAKQRNSNTVRTSRSFITSLKTSVCTLGDCKPRQWSSPKRSSSPTNTDSCEWPQRLGGLRWRARLFTDAREKVNLTPDRRGHRQPGRLRWMCVWSGRETGLESFSLLQRGLSAARPLTHTEKRTEQYTKTRAAKSPFSFTLFEIMLKVCHFIWLVFPLLRHFLPQLDKAAQSHLFLLIISWMAKSMQTPMQHTLELESMSINLQLTLAYICKNCPDIIRVKKQKEA